MPPSALAKAVTAGTAAGLSENAAKKGLEEAMGKLNTLRTKAAGMKKNAGGAAGAMVATGETLGATFVASTAEGVIQDPKKLKYLRAARMVSGGGLVVWGVIDALTGSKTGGAHQLALGTGVLASEIASLGVMAGQGLRDKYNQQNKSGLEAEAGAGAAGGGAATPAAAAPALTVAPGGGGSDLAGLREVHAERAEAQLRSLHGGDRFRPTA